MDFSPCPPQPPPTKPNTPPKKPPPKPALFPARPQERGNRDPPPRPANTLRKPEGINQRHSADDRNKSKRQIEVNVPPNIFPSNIFHRLLRLVLSYHFQRECRIPVPGIKDSILTTPTCMDYASLDFTNKNKTKPPVTRTSVRPHQRILPPNVRITPKTSPPAPHPSSPGVPTRPLRK